MIFCSLRSSSQDNTYSIREEVDFCKYLVENELYDDLLLNVSHIDEYPNLHKFLVDNPCDVFSIHYPQQGKPSGHCGLIKAGFPEGSYIEITDELFQLMK